MRQSLKIFLMLFVAGACVFVSCKKDIPQHNVPAAEDLVAGRLSGTWAFPSNIVTPENVPAEVFGKMRLVFTTDATGKPSEFLAEESPVIFGRATVGTWTIAGTEDSAKVNLAGVGPVDEFTIKVSTASLTLSFYMGWENTETKETGKGNFSVTLARQ